MQKASLKILLQQIKNWIVTFDSNILYVLSRKSGQTLLIGGWLIFILWVSGRYFLACDLEIISFIGFLWAYFGFFIGVFAIILLLIYTIWNINKLHFSIISTLLIILLNIPSVILILKLHGKFEKKAFVLFQNKTKIDGLKFEFVREMSKKKLVC